MWNGNVLVSDCLSVFTLQRFVIAWDTERAFFCLFFPVLFRFALSQ